MSAQAKIAVKPSLTLKRHLNAPPERVYAAWTDPQKLKTWFGPQHIETLRAEADARVGGRFRMVMRDADGEEHDVSGVYREVVPNRKLTYTWVWKDSPERESLVTMELRALGSDTEFTLRHEQFADAEAATKHEHGWTGCLARLEHYLA